MRALISKRKLNRLSLMIVCTLCLYGVYQVYLFHIQDRDLIDHLQGFETFDVSGISYFPNRNKGNNVGSTDNYQDYNKDKQFHNGHLLSDLPVLNDRVFIDTRLSGNLIDSKEKDNVEDDQADGQSFHEAEAKNTERDFHYPEIGYRYFGELNGTPDMITYNRTQKINSASREANKSIYLVSTISNNISVKFTSKSITKSKRAQPKVKNKPIQKFKPYSNVLPPAPVQNVTKRPEDKRYLVYVCDSFYWCGGWGDRQRGMMATYFLSRVVDREFKIIMTSPCNLRLFYKPNRVKWQPVGDELVSNSNISVNAFMSKDFLTSVSNEDLNSKYPERVIYLRTNQDYYGWLKKNSNYVPILNQWGGISVRKSRFHWAWSDVMQPSHLLMAHLAYVVNTPFLVRKGLLQNSAVRKKIKSIGDVGNSTFICSHVRVGKNPTNPFDENLQTFKLEYLPTLFKFMLEKDTQGKAKFFVATDFEHVQKEARKIFGDRLVHYGGKIVHIDRQRREENACVGFETALLDQLILSLCDILIVCKSGFSSNAAFMSNNTENVYIMMKDGVIKKF